MHRHIEWDDPGSASVSKLFANDHHGHAQIGDGDILSARYQGKIVRVEVEAYREEDAVSIAKVVAILDTKGNRLKGMDNLNLGDIVRLPDDKRAFEKREDYD
ncbi:hypothetical protein B0H98_105130 [Vreelandella songnenensis]|uniref:Uncharacterized protein n=1 Tax=Vreelandella songnenensis TaxID=1176243 RepID=A0A2T0V2R0_9GAMM|nr:hypothetical protein [Halomonas songnenensis]PRY64469.1 hypothetical protein B0H98_105130 [Halomonas songnenensis]